MGLSLDQVREYCADQRARIFVTEGGGLRLVSGCGLFSESLSAGDLEAHIAASGAVKMTPRKTTIHLQADGYETLALVLQRAFVQAAHGKGKERHANGEPFSEQVMQTGAHRFGVGSLLFQAFKKSEESQRLPHDRAVAELLGAINYLAGAVIAMERNNNSKTPRAANDNKATTTARNA